LIDAQTKKQQKRVAAIKQKCNWEESKHIWYLIKGTVKDLHSSSILRVQWVVNGEGKEQGIQQKCKVQFSLTHSSPIMKTLLRERLQYLSDKTLARSIIMGTYGIPSNMDPATELILEEISKLGIKIVNGDGNEIIITSSNAFGQK
jgi:hypothetical protein